MRESIKNLPNVSQILFGNSNELLPSVTELFELELAYLEYVTLEKAALINRSGFFKSIEGELTNHFHLYSQQSDAILKNRSNRTRSYFSEGQFSTGYATHGLFPYRGKFHPQLIKGLLNIIGIKPGDLVLDPLCGSGTLNIEASLMGINSIAIDISPFCQFMTKTKYDALTMESESLEKLIENQVKIFNYFNNGRRTREIFDCEKIKLHDFTLLAFLDAMGYSKRVKKSTHEELFYKVLERYVKTVSNMLNNPYFNRLDIGTMTLLPESDAKNTRIGNNRVDAVITSPPYSFAIDYVKNDQAQLDYLGVDIELLRSKMIGLKGVTVAERLEFYFSDMYKVCSEILRVLKPEKYFIMIIGSNTNQTGGVRLEQKIIEYCEDIGSNLVRKILKPIKGIRNTMKEEWILIFQKNG